MEQTKASDGKRNEKHDHQKYYVCDNCGYVTIIRDSYCPICAKDGVKIKMK